MDLLKRLLKPKPWMELDTNFVLELRCEECGFQTNTLWTFEELLYCSECEEAKRRRARLLQVDEEWEEHEE